MEQKEKEKETTAVENVVEDAIIVEETKSEEVEIADESSEVDTHKSFIMVGGNDESMATKIVETLNKEAIGATVYELTKDEMEKVISQRMDILNADAISEYVNHKDNIKQARDIANSFYIRYQDTFRKEKFVKLSDSKKSMQFTWKQFNEVIGTLDIFGHIEWEDDKKQAFKIILSEDSIRENKKKEIQFQMDIVKGKLIDYQKHLTDAKDLKEIEELKEKMTI